MFVEELVPNSYISIMITNFFIHVVEPMTTKSWQVTVYTEDGKFIDQIPSGLALTFKCYPPC